MESLAIVTKFQESIRGSFNFGKIMSLAKMLMEAEGSLEHYMEIAKVNPMGMVQSSLFVMKQAIVIDELLEPFESIADGSLKTEDFVLGRINTYERLIFDGHSTDLSNSNANTNLVQFERHKVYCDILKILKAK